MEAWSRFRTSFSSLPTTTSPSSSTLSSSASLCPVPLIDLADEHWFYRSVVPLPSLSLPCLPALFSTSPPPDPSTLLAQCMFTHLTSSRRLHLSSSSLSPPSTPPDSKPQTHLNPWVHSGCDAYNELSDRQETYGTTLCSYNENVYCDENEVHVGGYSSLSDSDEEEYAHHGYRRGNAGDDEEPYHYYTAASDWEDEDAYNAYHMPSDCDADQSEEEPSLADAPHFHADVEPDDALSGIYDVGLLLKDQQEKRVRDASNPPWMMESKAESFGASARPHIQLLSSDDEQRDMKESIKLWAHAVALTLPWKAAAQARPVL